MDETGSDYNLADRLNGKNGSLDASLTKTEILERLKQDSREKYLQIVNGEKLPPLTSDVMAKRIFNPNLYPERVNFLMRNLAADTSIDVTGSRKNESQNAMIVSTDMLIGIPNIMENNVLVSAQDLILTRGEIRNSTAFALQYFNKKAGSQSAPALFTLMMKRTPKIFMEYQSDHYIHRFTGREADSGFAYQLPVTIMYVELEKCLSQLNRSCDGESNPDLQILLAAIADINHPQVQNSSFKIVQDLIRDVYLAVQDQNMLNELLVETYYNDELDAVKYYNQEEVNSFWIQKIYGRYGVEVAAEMSGLS